jgi:MFS family permease
MSKSLAPLPWPPCRGSPAVARQGQGAGPGGRARDGRGANGRMRILLPLGLAVALSLPGDQTLYAVLPTQTATVGISVGAVGVLLSANRLIRIPGNPLAGLLYDRLGRRRLFLFGLLLGTISTALYGAAHGFWPLLGGRLLWGVAWSLINVGGYTMMLDVSSDADRGRWIGLYQVSYLLGLFFSPMLGGFLSDTLGFQPALFVCAAITGMGFLVAFFTLPETRGTGERAERDPDRGTTSVKAMRRRLDRRILVAAYLYWVTFFAGSGVLMSTISLYLRQRFGEGVWLGGVALGVASLGGMMLALRSLLAMLAGPMAGYLSDRRGDRWPVVHGGVLLGAVGFLILACGTDLWLIVAGVALVALSSGALLAALAALVGDATTASRQGRAIGGLATAGDLGSASGPLLAYALIPVIDLRWVYLMCAAGFMVGLVAIRGLGTR